MEHLLGLMEETVQKYQDKSSDYMVHQVNLVLEEHGESFRFSSEFAIQKAFEDMCSVVTWCEGCAHIGQDNDHLDKGLCYHCAMQEDEEETLKEYGL
jgi:hypothetical protein